MGSLSAKRQSRSLQWDSMTKVKSALSQHNTKTDQKNLLLLIGAVVIGRNEGRRLDACLASLQKLEQRVVYVDSGSTDDSLDIARRHGSSIIELDKSKPFTAARARNIGWRMLLERWPDVRAVQFVDGDCEVIDGWLEKSVATLLEKDSLAAICGQRKERFPNASVYNLLCDIEWNTPIGLALAVGGDALFRAAALQEVNGYDDTFIAGEEPEMCVRMRMEGWLIERIDQPMTWHDAAMTRFGHHWKRSIRSGYAYALGAAKHGHVPERHNVKQLASALTWGLMLPLICSNASIMLSHGWLLWFVYVAQVARLTVKLSPPRPFLQACFLTIGKFSEAIGILKWCTDTFFNRRAQIIEYKGSSGPNPD